MNAEAEDTDYEVKLKASQLQIIAIALQKAPYEVAAPILQSVQRQISEIEARRALAKSDGEAPAAEAPRRKPRAR